jgi:predicted RecB family nuclease
MQLKHGKYFFSPSDLTCFMDSPFASWMDRFAMESPSIVPKKDPEDALKSVLQAKGFTHEDEHESIFRDQELSVFRVESTNSKEQAELTLSAMQNGVDVIAQARLENNQFLGFADFLIKVAGASKLGNYHYEVWDTKLASKVKPIFAIQLCCYSEMLEEIQGVFPQNITVLLGTNEKVSLRTSEYFYYYLELKKSFLSTHIQFNSNNMPDPAESKSWGNWSAFAKQLLIEKDHLLQVANILSGQIKKLNQADIRTMKQLADTNMENIKGINPLVFQRLKAQASIQIASAGKSTPKFKIIKPDDGERSGLALLPPQSQLDVFFDIEGDPFDEGGLEYLWGNTYLNDQGERSFKDFWAHNRDQEKKAFEQFIHWVYERWQRDTSMHIYHYANYEITACRKLMGRYGVCEFEVDQLLRNEVFVDLYKLVKGCLILGEPKYSIKNVEHLYRGKRETAVAGGDASIAVYEKWRELNAIGEQGDTWQTSNILKDIRDYNIDDCDSTLELADWLRHKQKKHDISYLGKTEVVEPEVKEEATERTQLRDRLLEKALEYSTSDPKKEALILNLAWILEFHRREAKPVFWRLFERLGLSHVELLDDLNCLACCERTRRDAFKPTPRARNLAYEFQFDPAQEFKGASNSFYLLGLEDENGKYLKANYLEEFSDLPNGLIVLQMKQESSDLITIVPDEHVNANPIPHSIYQVVEGYESGQLERCAIIDFLNRSKPVIKNYKDDPIASSNDPNQRLQQVINSVKNLDNSYLTIQGPPGSGKSHTGKHIIAELVKTGAKIGVSSNSHKAINNLLLSTAKFCREEGINATFACTKETEPELIDAGVSILNNNNLANHVEPGCVLGTTAWGFSRDDMSEQLDYLFVDEAGQVSIANLVAMSRSSKNLVLMGDQMQLGQPSQGTHPAESGLSILDYLLHDTPTISNDMGVFLGTTYRMHSAINQFISTHIYDGKLESHPDNDKRTIKVPNDYKGILNKEAGIIFSAVCHEGNTQASDEEVAEIKTMVNQLLGRTFTELSDKSRPITLDDMLFVAPYNHQVSKLKQVFGSQAKVGSVDKFQGQEAPIVFLSMCASDASESPRGLDFLFDKHRINVAISRAQSLAIIVGNPRMVSTPVNRVDQLKTINLFNALCME